MPKNYEEEYQLLINYIESQITSINEKLENVDYYDKIRKAYNEIKGRDCSKFVEYYAILSKINSYVKDNLDVIDFLVKNNITVAPQMDESIDNILNNSELLEIVSSTLNKEMLSTQKEKLTSVLDGVYDFETFKDVLLNSNLDTEGIICILTREAEKSTIFNKKKDVHISDEKKDLPSLDVNNEQKEEIISKYNEILNKVNKLINKYYYLVQEKAPLIEMYRKTKSSYNMREINNIFSEKDVLLCMHILSLIDLKTEGEDILKNKPIDHELLQITIDSLDEELNNTIEAANLYEKESVESMPLDSTVYYVLDENGKPLFDMEKFSDEEKKNIDSLLSNLEMGLFDYEVSKGLHTIVKQNERRDLNVFVNKKRNMSVSYIRINSSDLQNSKVLIICIDRSKKIFDTSISILKTQSYLIDESVIPIKENNSEFISKQDSFKETLKEMISREEVPSV